MLLPVNNYFAVPLFLILEKFRVFNGIFCVAAVSRANKIKTNKEKLI